MKTTKAKLLKASAFVSVMLLAALTRLWNLGFPAKLVFDETYYVKDALTLSLEGHEKSWPDQANSAFEAGDVFGYLPDAAFVVHPPLGKWLISSGMWALGPENSFGWRISTALLGIATVGLLMLVAFKLFRSSLVSVIAGLALAIDGLAITLSRTALLDASLTFFLLLGFYLFLFDQASSRIRILLALEKQDSGVLWFRPWLLATGVALGLATAIKWSGLYLLAAIGIYVVISEMLLRKAAGEQNWFRKSVIAQGVASFLNLIPVAFASYLLTWLGWITGNDGYSRNWAKENPANGIEQAFPEWLRSLWHLHEMIYRFHVSLTTEHAYQAHPIGWLIGIRPTAFFYESYSKGENGCDLELGCSSAITALGNPALSVLGVLALVYLIQRYVRNKERNIGLVLLGVAALYLPWLIFAERTVFHFYSVSFQPWLLIGVAFVVQKSYATLQKINTGFAKLTLVAFLVLVVALSVFFLPINTGIFLPFEQWQWRMWLPSWI